MTLIDLSPTVLRSPRLDGLPVAIIGSGPIGLAAAANLVERGIDFMVYEAGDTAASSLASWGHIRLFSPWRHLIDPAARRLLATTGWTEPDPGVAPYGAQLVDFYLAPLAALPEIRSRIRTGSRVQTVTRQGMDRARSAGRSSVPFQLRLLHDSGETTEVLARAVIDASGTYSTPNPIGSNGLDPLGLAEVADRISPALPDVLGRDRARFAGRHTVVVGAGHSAANTLIALAKLAREENGTTVTWLIRNDTASRVSAIGDDELPGRASLADRMRRLIDSGAIGVVDGFEIEGVARTPGGVAIAGSRRGAPASVDADVIVSATGFRPDLGMLREIRLDLDDIVEAPRRLAPMIDPNVHSCGTVEPHGFAELRQPEPNFFIAGMKSYGRAPTFLLATGYEQVRSIVAWLDGDLAGASAVKLVLPATGVCFAGDAGSQSCCS